MQKIFIFLQPFKTKVVFYSVGTFEKGVYLNDNKIIELYFSRNQLAVSATETKFGSYCKKISMNILSDEQDTEEVLSDTYMQLWNTIPPQKPQSLMAYIAKITRNLAINKLKAKNAQKRHSGESPLSYDELDICTPSGVNVENEAEVKLLSRHISDFLYTQKEDARNIFVRKYFYCESVEDIADRFSFSISKVKSTLMRTREKLRIYLTKEGYHI